MLVPRLYTALLIAVSSSNEILISQIIAYMNSCADPLRSLLLRFTMITLFPRRSPQLIHFAVSNFNESYFFFERFIADHGEFEDSAIEWIVSNISIALAVEPSNEEIIRQFMAVPHQKLSLSAVAALVQSATEPILTKFLIEISQKIGSGEKGKEIASNFIGIVTKSSTIFEFVRRTCFSDEFALKTVELAIKESDKDTLRKCTKEWPNTEVYKLIISAGGFNLFGEIVDELPKDEPILVDLFKSIKNPFDPDVVHRFLKFESDSRSNGLNEEITQFMLRTRPCVAAIQTIFDESFVFETEKLFKVVAFEMIKQGASYDDVLQKAKNLRPELKTNGFGVLLEKLPRDRFSDLVKKAENSFERSLLLNKMTRFDFCAELADILVTDSELEAFAVGAACLGHHEEAQAALEKVLSGKTFEKNFEVLNVVCGVGQREFLMERDFLDGILAKIRDKLRVVMKTRFCAATPNELKKDIKIVNGMLRGHGFVDQKEALEEILDLLQKHLGEIGHV